MGVSHSQMQPVAQTYSSGLFCATSCAMGCVREREMPKALKRAGLAVNVVCEADSMIQLEEGRPVSGLPMQSLREKKRQSPGAMVRGKSTDFMGRRWGPRQR